MDMLESRGCRPLIFPFLLISFLWAGMLLGVMMILQRGGIDLKSFGIPFYLLLAAAELGPLLAAFLLLPPAGRRKEFFTRCFRSSAPVAWIFVIVLLAALPTVGSRMTGLFLGLPGLNREEFLGLLPPVLLWAVFAALGRGFGWQGFLLPALRERYGMVTSSLLLGMAGGLWQGPYFWLFGGSAGLAFFPHFLIAGPLTMIIFSLPIAWVHERTRGNIPFVLWFQYLIALNSLFFISGKFAPAQELLYATLFAGFGGVIFLFILIFGGKEEQGAGL